MGDPALAYAVPEDDAPTVVAVNDAFAETFGGTPERATAPLGEYLFPGEGTTAPDAGELATRLSAGERVRTETRCRVDDETRHYLLVSVPVADGDPVPDPDAPEDRVDGYVTYTDITAQKDDAQAASSRADRLSTLASVISHDLRNPLEVARIRLDAAEETGEDVHFEKVRGAHERLERIVEDVLALTDPRRGVTAEPVDPLATARAAWETVATANADLDLSDGPVGPVLADPDQLRRAFENLFRNAVEYAGDRPAVRVGPLDAAGFYIEDDGPGIPEADRERVFAPRETLENGGIGLGLSVVRRIARAHGWSVRATEGRDGGARFEFTGVDAAGTDGR
jgi:signal transduction histidine kinase